MVNQRTINRIRKMKFEKGYKANEISAKTGYCVETIYKYLKDENATLQEKEYRQTDSILDPYAEIIKGWLTEDLNHFYKQRHTAERVYNRLCEEYPSFNASYKTVQRLYNRLQVEITPRHDKIQIEYLPGEAQVSCHGFTAIMHGKKVDCYIVGLAFPYSNANFMQVILDRKTECVLQALQDIYHHIGGVPQLQKFAPNTQLFTAYQGDISNLSNDLFLKFIMFYGFKDEYFLPNSEGTKTVVRVLVQYYRRVLIGATPTISGLDEFNKTLLTKCDFLLSRYPIKNKQTTVGKLFQSDVANLLPIPPELFPIRSWQKHRVSKIATVTIDSSHRYFLPPLYANKFVYSYLTYNSVDFFSIDHEPIKSFTRSLIDKTTDEIDMKDYLKVLLSNPRALKNHPLYNCFPDTLKDYLEQSPQAVTSHYLYALYKVCKTKTLTDGISYLVSCAEQKLQGKDELLLVYEAETYEH